MIRFLIAFVALAALSAAANLPPRSQTEKRHFAKEHPCPVTQLPQPSCPHHVIDHIVPICAGGADKADNMQWQTLELSRVKDRIERGFCACVKHHGAWACPTVNWKPAGKP